MGDEMSGARHDRGRFVREPTRHSGGCAGMVQAPLAASCPSGECSGVESVAASCPIPKFLFLYTNLCNDLQPWAVNDTFAYGFVAASFTGGADNQKCGICLELTFSGVLAGKTFVVQNVNTGGDLGSNQFDVQVPGGGVGIFTRGCQTQWNAPSSGWGQQYGGISSDSECSQLPAQLQPGCHFRFDWYKNADNPQVTFRQVACPGELVAKSGIDNENIS